MLCKTSVEGGATSYIDAFGYLCVCIPNIRSLLWYFEHGNMEYIIWFLPKTAAYRHQTVWWAHGYHNPCLSKHYCCINTAGFDVSETPVSQTASVVWLVQYNPGEWVVVSEPDPWTVSASESVKVSGCGLVVWGSYITVAMGGVSIHVFWERTPLMQYTMRLWPFIQMFHQCTGSFLGGKVIILGELFK